ncbi:HNH endonuclease [Herbiconiux moechotypicola]|uniref:HNH endonuclease signature motif containing protein n=1 Tax=Herbiconiux moechotypicola TaxID=637393 RepID=A0ABP5QV51_9MICO|nr:HNH endonuclease signature motif containing protein [Herbiconiux moechotypicola]MCS5730960.1 HNH endonuclease [Herbiconiux moechotypicola]
MLNPQFDALLTADLGALTDAELLAAVVSVERVGRLVDAARVRLAGEVGARSRSELGDEGLSRAQNFATPAVLLAVTAGVSVRQARSRVELGVRMRGPVLLGGGVGAAPFPVVSAAFTAGSLAVEAAGVITRVCGELGARGVDSCEVGVAEQTLVDETLQGHLTPDQTARLAVRVRELLDPDGAEPRADRQDRLRSLTFTTTPDGMLRGRFALTPEQAGIWVSALHAMHSPRTTGPRFLPDDEAVAHELTADTRTAGQRNADTITELLTRATTTPGMPRLNGASTTVNVHITLNDLEAGRGAGWIDGIDHPIPASAVARLRCHNSTAVTVFGDHGEILHHGKTRRLFTPAQNRALAARDGGCIWPDCDRPPSWCETHHVTEWVSPDHPPGRTDIDNGVLLCHFHHRHLHRSAWAITMHHSAPHLIPPRWADPAQTPIPTTRRRTTTPAA